MIPNDESEFYAEWETLKSALPQRMTTTELAEWCRKARKFNPDKSAASFVACVRLWLPRPTTILSSEDGTEIPLRSLELEIDGEILSFGGSAVYIDLSPPNFRRAIDPQFNRTVPPTNPSHGESI